MAKARGADELLDNLGALRRKPLTPEAREQIAAGLAHRVNFVVAKAADVAREMKAADICSELQAAFARIFDNDRGCAAKTALARAALELECPAEAIFRAGIRHVQMEGSFGAPVDVAAELRGLCALGLAQVRSRGFMGELAELLADPQPTARIGAVRALASAGREDGVLLLRFKARTGDPDQAIIGECLTALLQLQPRESLEMVGQFLDGSDEPLRAEAALALGSSKLPEALHMLKQRYSREAGSEFRQTLLSAIASLRLPAAVDFLSSLVETESSSEAAHVIRALRIYRHDSALRDRLSRTIDRRADDSLRKVFQKEFGS